MSLLERLERAKLVKAAQEKDVQPETIEYYDEYEEFKDKIHMTLVKRANTSSPDEKMVDIKTVITQLVEDGGEEFSKSTKQKLIQQIYDETQGLGPLEKLLRDDTISEIMVNGPYSVYVERKGRLELTDIKPVSYTHLDVYKRQAQRDWQGRYGFFYRYSWFCPQLHRD